MRRLLSLLLVAALLLVPVTAFAALEDDVQAYLYEKLDAFRESKGLEPFKVSKDMELFAEEWSKEMASRDTLEHRTDRMFKDFYDTYGFLIGENIAFYYGHTGAEAIADKIMTGWINSPGHYANMTRAEDTHVGLGVAFYGQKAFATMNMGRKGKEGMELVIGDREETDTVVEEFPLIAGLNYSEKPFADTTKKRAIYGPGYIVEGRGHALNDAVRLVVREHKAGKEVKLLDKDGKEIPSKGLVHVYMLVPKNTPRPFRVKVDGVLTDFAFVEGTDFVKFASEFE